MLWILTRVSSAAFIYYILCTYISPPTASLSEVAVYPPKTIEEEDARLRELGHEVSEVEAIPYEKGGEPGTPDELDKKLAV